MGPSAMALADCCDLRVATLRPDGEVGPYANVLSSLVVIEAHRRMVKNIPQVGDISTHVLTWHAMSFFLLAGQATRYKRGGILTGVCIGRDLDSRSPLPVFPPPECNQKMRLALSINFQGHIANSPPLAGFQALVNECLDRKSGKLHTEIFRIDYICSQEPILVC